MFFVIVVPEQNRLVIDNYSPENESQNLEISGSIIRKRSNKSQVLEVVDGLTTTGAEITCNIYAKDTPKQVWTFEIINPKYV